MAIQQRNPEMVELLRPDLQARYEPQFAWKSACSQYLALTGLRGFWPLSAVDNAGMAQDLSSHALDLTLNGNPEFNYDELAPFCEYDGVGDFHSHVDHALLDILGTESYIASAARGLTFGGWFYFDNLARAENPISKNDGAVDNSYWLWHSAVPAYGFSVSPFGVFPVTVTSTFTPVALTWLFMVGRFDPGAELAIFVNTTKTTNVAGIPAAIFNGIADFRIGGSAGAMLDGRASLCFLCCAMLSDSIIGQLYQQTRAMFGV